MVDQHIKVTDVTARSSNGYNFIKGKVFSTENPKFAIQFLHGMSEHMLRYTEFFEYLCKKLDCAVIAHDQCGHGASVFDKSEYGIFAARRGYKHVVNDTNGFLQQAKVHIPAVPVFLMGYDMGSLIARISAVQFSKNYAGLILVGTSYKGFMTKLLLKMCKYEISLNSESFVSKKLYKKMSSGFNKKFEGRTEYDWLNSNEAELDKYLNDPICNFTQSVSAVKDITNLRLSANKDEWFKNMSNMPILILSGEDDPVCKFSAHTKVISDKLKANGKDKVQIITYKNARHALLHETCKEKVYEDIADWLLKTI